MAWAAFAAGDDPVDAFEVDAFEVDAGQRPEQRLAGEEPGLGRHLVQMAAGDVFGMAEQTCLTRHPERHPAAASDAVVATDLQDSRRPRASLTGFVFAIQSGRTVHPQRCRMLRG